MPGRTSRPWRATSSSAGSRTPSGRRPENAASAGHGKSWRKASAGHVAGRGAGTETDEAHSSGARGPRLGDLERELALRLAHHWRVIENAPEMTAWEETMPPRPLGPRTTSGSTRMATSATTIHSSANWSSTTTGSSFRRTPDWLLWPTPPSPARSPRNRSPCSPVGRLRKRPKRRTRPKQPPIDGDGGNRTHVRGRVANGVYRLSRLLNLASRGPSRRALREAKPSEVSPGGRGDPPGLSRC